MEKSFIIAEKPSVAADIARALGGFTKHDDYFESDQYLLSSAVGHLLEIAVPPEEEVKRGKWSFTHLPAIPSHFALNPIEKSESRLKLLVKLMKRKEVVSLINACDAGREGELIFRYIVQHAGVRKPITRLWLQSMTPTAIREGFNRLRTDQEMQPLADAAVCRSEADWLVGINGTRAMTAFNSKTGGFHLTPVGRVQTPTLAVVVEREEKIRRFVARPYWEVVGQFTFPGGEYLGKWFQPDWKKSAENPEDRADRLWDEAKARAIAEACLGKSAQVTEESKPTTSSPPLLYDLTSLQREANTRFGFSAKTTLALAQALYEKHKALTYPRTDSRALPEDYLGTVQTTVDALQNRAAYGPFAEKILASRWIKPNKRVFDNSKISDHFAIIPTAQLPKQLNELEMKLYDLVVKRFLAVFFPAAEYLQTVRISKVEQHAFRSEGKVLVNPGWLQVYGREAAEADTNLTPLPADGKVHTETVEVEAHKTRPPARFTEATLLSAMEGAGKFIEDEELRAAMGAKGLGTPATRAQIIEGLLTENYLLRENKELCPTAKAFSLVTLLRGLQVPELISPELTADWEQKLALMERGQLSRPEFMAQIVDMTKRIVAQAKNYDSETIPGDYVDLTVPCPKCGGLVKENYKKYQCQQCDFALWKIIAGRQLEVAEVETLLRERSIGPLEGFRSRLGRAFAASLLLNAQQEVEFQFPGSQGDDEAEAPNWEGQEPLGLCPKCNHAVYETPTSYLCEKAVGKAGSEKTCDFRVGRTILQRSLEREQIQKLLQIGKTDLLQRFISKRGRPFAAHLVRQSDGKIGFEFAPKDEGSGKKGPKKTRGRAA